MADRELEHPPAGHEEKDVNFIAITKFGIGLSLTVLVTLFVLWGLFHYFVGFAEKSYGAAASRAGAAQSIPNEPPQPRLQATPPIDLRDMRAAEDRLLQHYSWVDREKGVVRIPIERAMDILAERGLPSRPATAPPQATTDGRAPATQPAAGQPQGTANGIGRRSQPAAGAPQGTDGRAPGSQPAAGQPQGTTNGLGRRSQPVAASSQGTTDGRAKASQPAVGQPQGTTNGVGRRPQPAAAPLGTTK